MIKIVEFAPNSVVVEAHGKITKDDYIKVMIPFLEKAKNEKKLKVVMWTANDFDGYTFWAMMEDLKLGINPLHAFEKCAIATDAKWIINICKTFRFLIPYPIAIFSASELEKAKEWLLESHPNLVCKIDKSKGVALIEVSGILSSESFKTISSVIDPFIEQNGDLKGVLIHVKKFPYWENIDGLLSHISFLKNYHKKVKKVALVSDSKMAKIVPSTVGNFVKAEIKHFPYEKMEEAEGWVSD